MQIRTTRLAAAAAVAVASGALAVVPSFASPSAPTQAPAPAAGLVRLGNAIDGLSHALDLGALPATRQMSLVVAVKRPDDAGELAYIKHIQDPKSALYHHYLTPAQFNQRFGVSAANRTAVRSYLTRGGLKVQSVSTAGDLYSVAGSVAAVDKLLHVDLRSYRMGSLSFFATGLAPRVPASLHIMNVSGLNSLQHFAVPSHPLLSRATTQKRTPHQGTCVGGTCTGNLTPQDLWSVYNTGGLKGLSGRGQGIAMFGEGDTKGPIKDLRQFEKENHLPQVPVIVKHPKGDTKFTDTSGSEEWNIDTQASSGMAPNAKSLTLYFGTDLSDPDVSKVFSQFVDDTNGPKQASASYGECEGLPAGLSLPSTPGAGLAGTSTDDAVLTKTEQQGVVEGKSVFVSTGDTGSSCPVVYAPVVGAGNGVLNQGVPLTNSPASLIWSVAVGGTVLYTDGKGHRAREYGWAFGGGGDSLFINRPAYQAGVSGNALPCITGGPCRGIPDISAVSGDVLTNGYGIVAGGEDSPGGGTSLSAPLAQGLWADIQSSQKASTVKKTVKVKGKKVVRKTTVSPTLGFANYTFYGAGKSSAYKKYFFDVSSTDTATGVPATNGLYPTTPGWDYATGWGTLNVRNLAAFTKSHRGVTGGPTFKVSAKVATTHGKNHMLAVTVKILHTIKGTPPTGKVKVQVVNGRACTAKLKKSVGTCKVLTTKAKRHTLRVAYSGDKHYAAIKATRNITTR